MVSSVYMEWRTCACHLKWSSWPLIDLFNWVSATLCSFRQNRQNCFLRFSLLGVVIAINICLVSCKCTCCLKFRFSLRYTCGCGTSWHRQNLVINRSICLHGWMSHPFLVAPGCDKIHWQNSLKLPFNEVYFCSFLNLVLHSKAPLALRPLVIFFFRVA